MDYKELYQKGDFEGILKESEGKKDAESLFYRISAYLALGKGKEAQKTLLDNRDLLFSSKPSLTLKANFEIDFDLEDFEQAYEDLDYYRNAPYASQEVEEALAALPKKIRDAERASLLEKNHPEEDLDGLLQNPDPYLALGALRQLGQEGIAGHEKALVSLLSSSAPKDVRSFALQVLLAHGYGEEVEFLTEKGVLHLVPKDLMNPYEEKNALSLRKMLSTLQEVSLASVCTQILDQLCLSCFPDYPFSGKPLSLELEALLHLGREYLGQKEEAGEEVEEETSRLRALLSQASPLP